MGEEYDFNVNVVRTSEDVIQKDTENVSDGFGPSLGTPWTEEWKPGEREWKYLGHEKEDHLRQIKHQRPKRTLRAANILLYDVALRRRAPSLVQNHPKQVTLFMVWPNYHDFSVSPLHPTCLQHLLSSWFKIKGRYHLPLGWRWMPQTTFPSLFCFPRRPTRRSIEKLWNFLPISIPRSVGLSDIASIPIALTLKRCEPGSVNQTHTDISRFFPFPVPFLSFSLFLIYHPSSWVSARYHQILQKTWMKNTMVLGLKRNTYSES